METTKLRDSESLWRVAGVRRENKDVNSLFLEGGNGRFATRKAGQFATLRLPTGDGWTEAHPFTIAAAPEDPLLCFTIKKEGAFTSAIPNLPVGTPVLLTGPLGRFCRDIDSRPEIVMLAGGVGITPFLSVLRHFRHRGAANRVLLFWSNKTKDDIFCADELREMTQLLPLVCVHCLSREDEVAAYYDAAYPGIVYERGRLTASIMDRHGTAKNASFYLCGPPAMMDTAFQILAELGVPPGAVEQERFVWKR
ncbi:MAG: hypothetical protein N2Z74_07240 [Syntrophales bacterium]|nr:hypothetical protein [Syntrophales bacterium]